MAAKKRGFKILSHGTAGIASCYTCGVTLTLKPATMVITPEGRFAWLCEKHAPKDDGK